MSVQTEINRIKNAKNDISNEIVSQGGSVPQNAKISQLAGAMKSMPKVRSVCNKTPDSGGNVNISASDVGAGIFSCTFYANRWTSTSGYWTQTSSCSGMSASYNCEPPWFYKTKNKQSNENIQKTLDILNNGILETQNGSINSIVYEKPQYDITIYTRRS